MRLHLIGLLMVVMAGGCAGRGPGVNAVMPDAGTSVRHIVMVAYNTATTPDDETAIENGFRALKDAIPGILDFECGTNVSPEMMNQGYTHCFMLTFVSETARDAYLPHPAHKAFGALFGPHIGKILVFDYPIGR